MPKSCSTPPRSAGPGRLPDTGCDPFRVPGDLLQVRTSSATSLPTTVPRPGRPPGRPLRPGGLPILTGRVMTNRGGHCWDRAVGRRTVGERPNMPDGRPKWLGAVGRSITVGGPGIWLMEDALGSVAGPVDVTDATEPALLEMPGLGHRQRFNRPVQCSSGNQRTRHAKETISTNWPGPRDARKGSSFGKTGPHSFAGVST
jgi:hypothetical protein